MYGDHVPSLHCHRGMLRALFCMTRLYFPSKRKWTLLEHKTSVHTGMCQMDCSEPSSFHFSPLIFCSPVLPWKTGVFYRTLILKSILIKMISVWRFCRAYALFQKPLIHICSVTSGRIWVTQWGRVSVCFLQSAELCSELLWLAFASHCV